MRISVPVAAFCLAVALLTQPGEAHKGITSRFTYHADLFPIFLNRCSHCHVAGGVGPMSLVTYEDAMPWAESLRTELLEVDNTDPDFIKAAHGDLPARDLDVILDWATGGAPPGDASLAPAPVALKNDWSHGAPHLALHLPAVYEMPASEMDTTQEFALAVSLDRPREVAAIDLLPGTPAIVRDVVLSIRTPNGRTSVLGTWTPRQNPAPITLRPAVRFDPGNELVARIHYKKTWKYEGQAMADRSTVGLYFAP